MVGKLKLVKEDGEIRSESVKCNGRWCKFVGNAYNSGQWYYTDTWRRVPSGEAGKLEDNFEYEDRSELQMARESLVIDKDIPVARDEEDNEYDAGEGDNSGNTPYFWTPLEGEVGTLDDDMSGEELVEIPGDDFGDYMLDETEKVAEKAEVFA